MTKAYKLKFDGKIFDFASGYYATREDAEVMANKLRNDGYNIRIVERANGFAVYDRPNDLKIKKMPMIKWAVNSINDKTKQSSYINIYAISKEKAEDKFYNNSPKYTITSIHKHPQQD